MSVPAALDFLERLAFQAGDLAGMPAPLADAVLDAHNLGRGAPAAASTGRSVAVLAGGRSFAVRRVGSVVAAVPGGTRTRAAVGIGAVGVCVYGAHTAIQRHRQRRADEHTGPDTPPQA